MNATYAIDDRALSSGEIELIVQAGRRNPDAGEHGRAQARQLNYRMVAGLSLLAASVWGTNAYVVLAYHPH